MSVDHFGLIYIQGPIWCVQKRPVASDQAQLCFLDLERCQKDFVFIFDLNVDYMSERFCLHLWPKCRLHVTFTRCTKTRMTVQSTIQAVTTSSWAGIPRFQPGIVCLTPIYIFIYSVFLQGTIWEWALLINASFHHKILYVQNTKLWHWYEFEWVILD